MDTRTERVVMETDRHRIEGDVTMPRQGYRSRLSDYLNRGEMDFIPVANATIGPLDPRDETPPEPREFIAVARTHVHLAYPAGAGNGAGA